MPTPSLPLTEETSNYPPTNTSNIDVISPISLKHNPTKRIINLSSTSKEVKSSKLFDYLVKVLERVKNEKELF